MTLYMIGLGLNDEADITIKGLEAVKRCDYIYLENYTSALSCPIETLEKLYGKKIILADRDLVEKKADEILEKAQIRNVAFLVVGDIFSATTHTDLWLRAKNKKIKTKIIHNASVLTAIGETGLQLYKFGKTTSIPFKNENIEAPYNALKENQKNKLHTLFLLDLGPKEKKFMAVNDAIRYLLKLEIKKGEKVFTDSTLCIGCTKLGSLDQVIKAGKASELLKFNFKQGVQCLIVPSELHFMEEDVVKTFS